MKIEHVAIWTNKLEEMKEFYEKFFNGVSNAKYVNTNKGFESYFISFDNGMRLELMKIINLVAPEKDSNKNYSGYAHIAFSLDSKNEVDELSQKFKSAGIIHKDGPRVTGDGYYEACFLDPDGNRIELVADN